MKILGIDVGGTRIKTGFVEQTTVSEKNSFPTPPTYESFQQLLEEIILSYQEKEAFTKIAFSVPGSVNESGTVLFGGAVPYLNEVNLPEFVAKWSLSAVVENDAKAATYGELKYGNLKEVQNGAAVILGTGVGVGIGIQGELYKGSHYQAGEVSFLIRDRSVQGADSFVGMGLSAVALVKKLSAILAVEADGKIVFEALATTDKQEAKELFLTYCKEVAVLCFNMQCFLDLDKIVLGGGISQQPRVIATVQNCYQSLFQVAPIIQKTLTPIPIEAAKFQADANLIGAVKKF